MITWFHHFNVLKAVQYWMGTDAGYAVLFGLLFSCGLGVPLPEDIPLLLAGYFVAIGKMNLLVASICGWCGIIAGDCVLYLLGRTYGLEITKLPVIGSHVTRERIDYAHNLFEKYGVWVVAVGRLFAGIRGAMVITAGAIRFTFLHFIVADGLAAIVSGGLFIALGYWAGHKLGDLESIRGEVEKYQRWVLLGVIVLAIGLSVWHVVQKRRKSKLRGFPIPNDQ
jgi:membrane protein DedA with SNARE-associated domain